MSIQVEEILTRVIPTPPAEEPKPGGPPRLGAKEEAWAATYQLARRDGCRTAARDFDD